MLSTLKSVYEKLPKNKLKFLKYIPDGVLFGKSYLSYQDKVSFDKAIINQKLFDILNYSRDNTHFGLESIPKKIYIDEVKDILNELPLITSTELADNLDHFTSFEFQKSNAYLAKTGGTGGNPTSILLSNESYGIEWAHMHHIWSYVGHDRKKDMKLTLRGKRLKGSKIIEYNPVYNELLVDTFKVKYENFENFLKEIKKYNIKYIHGYPSLIKEFMVYFEKYNYIPELKGILLGSEGCSKEDKKIFANFFDTKIIHWYGQTEKVTLAVDEEANNIFRVYTSYGYPRVVNGELVATTFINKALPLINYRTGDGAEIIEDENSIYLTNISSRRAKDFIYLNKNKKISVTPKNLYFPIQEELLSYQIYQKQFGKIEIKILQKVSSKIPTEKLLEIFYSGIKEKLNDFIIMIKSVDENEIQKSHRGKIVFLVQEIRI